MSLAPRPTFSRQLMGHPNARAHAQQAYRQNRLMHEAVKLQFETVREIRPNITTTLPEALHGVDCFVAEAESHVMAKIKKPLRSKEATAKQLRPYLASWGGENRKAHLEHFVSGASEDDLQTLIGLTGFFDFVRARNFEFQREGFIDDLLYGAASCFTISLACMHVLKKSGLGDLFVLHLPNHLVLGLPNKTRDRQLLIDWGKRFVPDDFFDASKKDFPFIPRGQEPLAQPWSIMAPVYQSLAIQARESQETFTEQEALSLANNVFGDIALVNFCLARAHLEMGMRGRARVFLLRALSINPEYPRAKALWEKTFASNENITIEP